MYSNASTISLSKINTWKVMELADMVAMGANTAGTGYGAMCKLKDKDSRFVILVHNTHGTDSATVTLQPGNGIQATAKAPSVTLAAGEMALIQVESGAFKYVSPNGALAAEAGTAGPVDKVFVTGTSASVKVCVLHTVM